MIAVRVDASIEQAGCASETRPALYYRKTGGASRSDHAGTPNKATMSRALNLIRASAVGESLFELACGLADAGSYTAQAWCRHPSAKVRRAVAVAVKYAVRQRAPEPEPGEPLLLAKVLLARKHLGPFAIGDGLCEC